MPYLNTILHEFNFKNNTNENKLLDTIISNKKYADSVSLKDFCRMDPEFITWLNSESSDWSAVNVEYFITNSINYFSIVSFIQRNPESSIEVLDTFFTHCGHLLDSVLIEQISYSLSRENYVYKDKVSDYFNEKYPDIDSVIHPFIFMLPHKKDEIIRFHGCYELMSLNASDFHSKILNYLVMDQEPNNEYAKDIEFDVLSL